MRDHHSAYDTFATDRCERALLTLLGDVGPWNKRIYLAGGLAPRYLVGRLPDGARPHVGTTDVDLIIGLTLDDEAKARLRNEAVAVINQYLAGFRQRLGQPTNYMVGSRREVRLVESEAVREFPNSFGTHPSECFPGITYRTFPSRFARLSDGYGNSLAVLDGCHSFSRRGSGWAVSYTSITVTYPRGAHSPCG